MAARITIGQQHYNDRQHTDMNAMAQALLLKPTQLTPVMTHLGGKESDKFPLSMATEGMFNSISIDNLEYEYNVMTNVTQTRPIATTFSGSQAGLGRAPFEVEFPDRWFIKDYVLISRSGVQCRVMADPVPVGKNYRYRLQVVKNDPNLFVPTADVTAGARWGMLFAPVGTDYSRGNASNWTAPSQVRQKLTTCRKSYHFSGNAKDAVVTFEIEGKGGKKDRRWMSQVEWQYYLQWLEEKEVLHWYAHSSYNSAGITDLLDENGQPIIVAPGLLEQIQNKDTYAELTETKLQSIITDVFFGMRDGQNKQVTLFTGTGGAREFDQAMKNQLSASSYRQTNNDKFVTGSGRTLTSTGFFTTYEHIDGHKVNLVKVPLFDYGVVADTSPRHPKTGLPLESYRMVFVDQARYDGLPNLMKVSKKGRELIRWGVAGSVLPMGSGNAQFLRASDIDGASVHWLSTGHVLLRRFDTSIDLQCVAGI